MSNGHKILVVDDTPLNVKLLADLKPSFFRFPGGCFAEGRTLQDTFLFKETVGPIEVRLKAGVTLPGALMRRAI